VDFVLLIKSLLLLSQRQISFWVYQQSNRTHSNTNWSLYTQGQDFPTSWWCEICSPSLRRSQMSGHIRQGA